MRCSIRFITCAVILLCNIIGETIATERKMCVEYRILHSRWNHTVLKSIAVIRKSDCLVHCARNPGCGAYNWIHTNGTCELLPSLGDCPGESMEEEEDSTFVHLEACTDEVPWVAPKRNWSEDTTCLTWRRVDAFSGVDSCAADILRSPSHLACASLIPSKGIYLPGWYINGQEFRTVTEDVKPLVCSGNGVGFLLRVAPRCPTNWIWYSVGEPIPINAVKASIWKDGTPLYFVTSTDHTGFWHMGYLLPSIPQTFIFGWSLKSPATVKILVFT